VSHPLKCPRCGAALNPRELDGQCLSCLLQIALTEPELEPASVPSPDPGPTGQLGECIGHYHLLRQLGEGGFGIVYLAEQEQPVRRQVALKIIKPGMDTREVIARFEAERQALALMDHAGIARVFDGGTTAAGHPYFVMEFVDGVRITDYCDAHALALRDRLGLFIQVCQAVQHAHQKGVIHRDLKPSNILVTEQDGRPLPKVIDFGIAKAALGRRLTTESLHTAFQQFAGTPAYMSPEQAGLGGLDVDSRSDIYSLGMLLYELLVAQPAFGEAELARNAQDEMLRTIREKEPARPSARLTTLTQAKLTTVARHRQTEPVKLQHLLRGDLDWIVMKALEKDRNRRYETASGLAMDIQRHLDQEPVLARPPDPLYRLSRLLRRNQLACTAIAAIAAALLLGLGLSTWLFLREKAARQRAVAAEHTAEHEASRSQQVATFLTAMLKGVGPAVAQGRDTKLLREILDQTVQRIGRDLPAQPEVAADLLGTIGNVYRQLGDYPRAEALAREALALRRQVFGGEHPKVAESLNDLGLILYRDSQLNAAETVLREALAQRTKLLGAEHRDVATSLGNLGVVLWERGQLAAAETLFRQSLALRRKLLGNTHEEVAESLDNLGLILSVQDKLSEAEAMQREAVALNRQFLGDAHPDLAISRNNLADTLHAAGKLVEAEQLNREVLAQRKKVLGDEHPDVAFSLYNLATVLADEGKLVEAETQHRAALAMRRKLLGTNHLEVAGSLNNLAGLLIQQRQLDEAETMQREALAIQRQAHGAEHQDIAGSLDNLAIILQARGRLTDAEATQREVLAMRRKLLGEEHLDVAMSFHNLANLLQIGGQLAEAETLQRQALTLRKQLLGNEHSDVAAALAGLADVLFDAGKRVEAEAVQQEELALRRKLISQASPPLPANLSHLLDALCRLTRTLLAETKFTAAEPLAREAVALGTAELPEAWQTANARSLLGGNLLGQQKFADAEPLLLAGYEGLRQHEAKIPAEVKSSRLTEAIQRLIQLYQATNRPAQAASWEAKLPPNR
jgi:serine/threonine protein kinase/tetratricopeptide (TPR) repeat protein